MPSPASDPIGLAPVASAGASVSAPFDLSRVIRRVHFGYRAEAGGFVGEHATYRVAAAASGTLEVTPFAPADEGDATRPVVGAPLRLSLTSVGRASTPPAPPSAQVAVAEGGGLLLHRGDALEERVENSEAGAEQSWVFGRRPAGRGDLVVRVQVSGEEFAGETDGGLHFRDPVTGVGVRYGHASFVDASGRRTEVRARLEGESIVLAVPAEVVDDATYPAILDPLIGPEIAVDDPIVAPASGDQTAPAVAFDGANYLVVWQDFRSAVSANDVFGARVTKNGDVLDPSGIAISTAASDQTAPAVAFNGTSYTVVWTDKRSGQLDIHAARVSTAGIPLDPGANPICVAPGSQTAPAIACAPGVSCLAVWQDGRSSTHIYGARIALDGTPVDVGGVLISSASFAQTAPAVAFNGTSYLAVWQDPRNGNADVYGARVAPTGASLNVIDLAANLAINLNAAAQSNPAVESDGNAFLVVWQDARNATNDIYGAHVTAAGTTDANDLAISTALGTQSVPALAWDGTSYLVAWQDARNATADVYGARLSAAGQVQDLGGLPISSSAGSQTAPAVASDGAGFFAVWQDARNLTADVFGARVAQNGALLDPAGLGLARGGNAETVPAVGFDGTNYLVAWADNRNAASLDIYAVRLAADGTVLDPAGITVATAPGEQTLPAISADKSNWLVVWQDGRNGTLDVYGARLSPQGVVLDPSGIGIGVAALAQAAPAVAFGGTNHMVVWQDTRGGTQDIYAARVDATGLVLDPSGVAVSAALTDQTAPAIAFNGTSHLVVWQDLRGGTLDIYGSRLTTAGVVTDATGFVISDAALAQAAPSVASDGAAWLVAWQDGRAANQDVYAARVAAAGTVTDAAGVALTSNVADQVAPSVVFDGYDYVVAWQDLQSAISLDVYATWVSKAAVVQPAGGVAVSQGTTNEQSTALASARTGQSLIAYQNYDTGAGAVAERVRARLVSRLSPLGAACKLAADCTSAFCADGVCCNAACGAGDTKDCQACSVAAGGAKSGVCGARAKNAVCRAVASVCDAAEACDGVALTCPADKPAAANVPCRASVGACDAAESCDGKVFTCPADLPEADGTACSDGDACSIADTCSAGACAAGAPVVCPLPDPCHEPGACDPQSGTCSIVAKADGTACEDADPCTIGDTCLAGACAAGSPVVCAAIDGCHEAGACDPGTGACSNPVKVDGASCDDGDACTTADTCAAGVCAAGAPVACQAIDACHEVGACDPATGACSAPVKVDGASCDDGDACTLADSCVAGSCAAGAPVECAPIDECHAAGACDKGTGACSNPALADGSACSKGTCQSGACEAAPDAGAGGAGGAGGGGGSGGSAGHPAGTGGGAGGSVGDAGAAGGAATSTGAPAASAPPDASNAKGCGCRVAGEPGGDGAAAAVSFAGLALLVAGRRRRARRGQG